jgi:hypothetical protein
LRFRGSQREGPLGKNSGDLATVLEADNQKLAVWGFGREQPIPDRRRGRGWPDASYPATEPALNSRMLGVGKIVTNFRGEDPSNERKDE